MKLIVITILALVISVSAISQTNDDEDIYRTVLKGTKSKKEKKFLVLKKTNSSSLKHLYGRIDNGLLFITEIFFLRDTSWKLVIEKGRDLEKAERSIDEIKRGRIEVIEEDSLYVLFKNYNPDEGWNQFYKKYKKIQGYKEFSRISYSDDGNKAVVYCAFYKGPLNGRGFLNLLEKLNGKWKIIESYIPIWYS